MAVVKRTVSVDPQVWAAVEAMAGTERVGVSTVINRLLAHEVRLLAGIAAIAEYEKDAGAFTAAETEAADRALDALGVGASVAADDRAS